MKTWQVHFLPASRGDRTLMTSLPDKEQLSRTLDVASKGDGVRTQHGDLIWFNAQKLERAPTSNSINPEDLSNKHWSSNGYEAILSGFVFFSGMNIHNYPLVNVYIAMEHHHFSWENSLFQWWFSIVMLVYQRVLWCWEHRAFTHPLPISVSVHLSWPATARNPFFTRQFKQQKMMVQLRKEWIVTA